MPDQIPQPQTKGLSKGCTVALIIGGAVVVIVAALFILLYAKRDEFASWAFAKAIEAEKTYIMMANIPGIDTVAVNKVADGFSAKINSEGFDILSIPSYQTFVSEHGTDMKVDSAEAENFVQAMIECYPELADLYNPEIMDEETPDSTMIEEDSQ